MGDTANFSGDFRGAIVNYKSVLTDVQQAVQALPAADDAARQELERLIADLSEALADLPADKAEVADAVAQQTQRLVEEAGKPQPNKTLLGITANGLKQATETVADVGPKVMKVANQIADFFERFG